MVRKYGGRNYENKRRSGPGNNKAERSGMAYRIAHAPSFFRKGKYGQPGGERDGKTNG